jgi:initiation factor 1A
MLGNGRVEAMCFDGEKRLAHIRGKMRKKVRGRLHYSVARAGRGLPRSIHVDLELEGTERAPRVVGEGRTQRSGRRAGAVGVGLTVSDKPFSRAGRAYKSRESFAEGLKDEFGWGSRDERFEKEHRATALAVLRVAFASGCLRDHITSHTSSSHGSLTLHLHPQVWINQGDIILLSLRDFQDDKADVIQKYTVRLASSPFSGPRLSDSSSDPWTRR